MELDAQYERIVRLIPVDELASSYNRVVQEGVSSLHHAVDDVATAFAKLKEVRDAVSRLQHGRLEISASHLSTVSSILKLQLELETKLGQVVGPAKTQKKRRRPQQVSQVIARVLCDEKKSACHRSLLDAYHRFLKRMTIFERDAQDVMSKARFKGLHNKLSRAVKELDKALPRSISRKSEIIAFDDAAERNQRKTGGDGGSPGENFVPKAMLDDNGSGQQKWQIINSFGQITEWITDGLAFRGQKIYHRCADTLISYAKQYQQTEPLQRVADKFSRAIGHSSSNQLPAVNRETQTAELDRLLIGMSETLLNSMDLSCMEVQGSKERNSIEESEARKELATQTSEAMSNNCEAAHVVTSDSDSSFQSDSESESDYEDEKEAIGGSEAAWNSIMAAAVDPSKP
ncbi:uncharacterized protein IUM83_10097 [Phytophthora cinnamomi]|uniref:uncharacterized protein n=1 Tax=Phytophthora cinnamomi TaxID=4785 RepID=UPI0035598F15|nr:hypothetical protein IUM83_10097 [Phytophthora cinnamomi]